MLVETLNTDLITHGSRLRPHNKVKIFSSTAPPRKHLYIATECHDPGHAAQLIKSKTSKANHCDELAWRVRYDSLARFSQVGGLASDLRLTNKDGSSQNLMSKQRSTTKEIVPLPPCGDMERVWFCTNPTVDYRNIVRESLH